jgi:wyosine [tRNA(Phe)-imidazoG37] synthetase (radical SAM superfamily)
MKERSLDNADLSNYSKVKSPFKDSFLQKGILEILDKLASHVNEDIAAQTDIIIHKLKDDI